MSEDHALAELIEDFRAELEAEIPMRLHPGLGGGKHTKGGPAESEYEPGEPIERRWNGGGRVGWTGLPFTPAFQRYLGHSENYGYEFIAAASFDEIAAYCRSKHDESHSAGGPTASTCRRIAVAVVELRQPIPFVAVQEDVGIFAVRKSLLDVLRHAERWRQMKRDRAVAHDTADEPASLDMTLRRQHDEAREQRVWNLLRLRHPYLPDWEFERGRRLEQHIRLGCSECLTKAA